MSVVTCNDLPTYVVDDCPTFKLTGISAIAVLKFDIADDISDYTNATQWNTAITNGNATIIGGESAFKGIYTPNEITVSNPGACGAENILQGFAHELQVTDAVVSSTNDTFYEGLNKFKGYIALYYCNEDEIRVFDQDTVNFAIMPPANPDGKEIQRYSGMVRWETDLDEFGTLYTAPVGIF